MICKRQWHKKTDIFTFFYVHSIVTQYGLKDHNHSHYILN